MKRWLAFAFCLFLPSSLAHANGEGPSRKMTGPEAAAFDALKSAFQGALPKTPTNYALAIVYGHVPASSCCPRRSSPTRWPGCTSRPRTR